MIYLEKTKQDNEWGKSLNFAVGIHGYRILIRPKINGMHGNEMWEIHGLFVQVV